MLEHFEVYMEPLNRNRMVRVYLPENYYMNEEKRYPVLYMHDGQNLFKDEDASFGMSWGISDYLESSQLEMIVVGIDCNDGLKRLDEYTPWTSSEMRKIIAPEYEGIGGEGEGYVEYIVHHLKPMIDQKYRTVATETSMAGSSMGGLISTYAACRYPHIFGKIASISSAYWFNQDEIENFIKKSDLSTIEKFYLDVGTNEANEPIGNTRYIQSSEAVYHLLKNKVDQVQFEIIEGAVHNELAWRKRVPSIFSYLFGTNIEES